MFRDRIPLTVEGSGIYDKHGERIAIAGTDTSRKTNGEDWARFLVNAVHRNYRLPELPEEVAGPSPVEDDVSVPDEPQGEVGAEETPQGEVGAEVIATISEPTVTDLGAFEDEAPDEGPTEALLEAAELHKTLSAMGDAIIDPVADLMASEGLSEKEAIAKYNEGMEPSAPDPISELMVNEGLSEEDAIARHSADEHAAFEDETESDGTTTTQGKKPRPVSGAAILKRPGPKKRTLA